ncbi:MAG: hypothetical protein ACFFDT_09250 [Candidatus Hodarchaeota archaeon]
MTIKFRLMEKQLRLRTIHLVCFAYLVSNATLSYIGSLSEMFKSFLSLPTFLLFPYLFGHTILIILNMFQFFKQRVTFTTDFVSRFALLWFLGLYSIVMVAVSAQLLNLPFVLANLHIFILISIFAGLFYTDKKIKLNITLKGLFWLTICSIIAIAFVLVAKNMTPFPRVGVDGQRLVLIYQPAIRLIKESYLTPDLRIPEYLITAIISVIHNIDPLSFLWSSSFVLTVLYATGVYYLANTIYRNKYLSIIATSMSLYIFVGYPFLFSDTPVSFFRTSTILLVFFPLILRIYYKSSRSQSFSLKQFGAVLIAGVTSISVYYLVGTTVPFDYLYIALPCLILALPIMGLVLGSFISRVWSKTSIFYISYLLFINFLIFHNYESLVYIASILIYILAYFVACFEPIVLFKYREAHSSAGKVRLRFGFRFISLVLLALCLLFIGLQYGGIIKFPNNSMISGVLFGNMYESLEIDFAEKYKALEIANTPFINVLTILSLVFLLTEKKASYAQVGITLSILFFLYFLPEFSLYRVHQQLKPLTSMLLAFVMNKIYKLLSIVPRVGKWLKFLYVVTISIMIGTTITPAYLSAFSFIPVTESPGLKYQDIIAEYEYEAALWLKHEMPDNLLIISDHHTMRYLASLANKPYTSYREMRPHSLPWFKSVYQQQQQIRRAITDLKSSIEVYLAIINFDPILYYERPYLLATGKSIEKATYVIVITPRTIKWLTGGSTYFPTAGIVDKEYIKVFLDNKFFIPRYNSSDRVYIFEVQKTNLWYSYKNIEIPAGSNGYFNSAFIG